MTEWIYETNADNSARYLLGTVGENPLVCVGVNPSTAAPGDPDATVRRVMSFADRNGHDSWMMLNLYPQRSKDPTGMHLVHDAELQAANERHIAEFIGDRQLTLLAAWGELIRSRDYLLTMLQGIAALITAAGCDWVSIGDLLKSGHPRHPSRAGYLPLQPFDINEYLHVADRHGRAPRAVASAAT